MSIHNRYANFVIVAEDYMTYDASILAALEIMEVLPEVNPVILKHVVKIGGKTEMFTEQTMELARQNPGLLPVDLNITEIEGDLAARKALRIRYLTLIELAKRVRGAMTLLGTDAYTGALAAYKSMKVNNRNEALTEQIRELGRIFMTAQEEQGGEEEPPVEPPIA